MRVNLAPYTFDFEHGPPNVPVGAKRTAHWAHALSDPRKQALRYSDYPVLAAGFPRQNSIKLLLQLPVLVDNAWPIKARALQVFNLSGNVSPHCAGHS